MLVLVCACLSQLKWLWYIGESKSLQDFRWRIMRSMGCYKADVPPEVLAPGFTRLCSDSARSGV